MRFRAAFLGVVSTLLLMASTSMVSWPTVSAASRAPSASEQQEVLVGKDITQPSDTITYQVFDREGKLISTQTEPVAPATYIETSVEPLSDAVSQGVPYVPLPSSPSQWPQAEAQLHTLIAQQEGVSGQQAADPTIGCNQSIRATGAYQFPDASTTVNYAVTYNTYNGACGIAITDYAANLNPSTSSSVYQCTLSWQDGGYSETPDVRIPNYYPNDDWYNAGDLGWTGGGGYNFYTYAGLNGCSVYDHQAYGYMTLNN
ncbi:hypothetical protein [Sulfobacillus harzensis]|uniref:G5 domain-containing protein n=1 Tax=Sulfobacillus harzensis TaxID=2729629 RepID=A0A7Y0L151_9FIRM|nr:hypothetical protein [Sulfobacillus harzensis]NMP21082.1 hypothetical protein [Sulfobacillus harzensis]